MGAGTPIVSIGLQPEQDISMCARGKWQGLPPIKLEQYQWKDYAMTSAIERVLEDPSYGECARSINKETDMCDGSAISAEAILNFAMNKM